MNLSFTVCLLCMRGIVFFFFKFLNQSGFLYIFKASTRFETKSHLPLILFVYFIYIYIYIYIYVYLGSISSLMQISLNIIDILCLHIFFWIRSNSRITFIVFGGN